MSFDGLRNFISNAFPADVKGREHSETHTLYREVNQSFIRADFADGQFRNGLINRVTRDVIEKLGTENPHICNLVESTVIALVDESDLFQMPWMNPNMEMSEAVEFRKLLRRKQIQYADPQKTMGVLGWFIESTVHGILDEIPSHALQGQEEGSEHDQALSVSVIDLIGNPAYSLDATRGTLGDDGVQDLGLLFDLGEQMAGNIIHASGIGVNQWDGDQNKLVTAQDQKKLSPRELVKTYMGRTPFEEFFLATVPYSIPLRSRFEHSHILGGTGHGKTQLIQTMLLGDIQKAREGKGSLVVLDGQGDLLRAVSHLSYFDDELRDQLLIIDANDAVEYPVAINMFHLDHERLNSYSAVDRERILNGTIDLYEYIFGALLGADLTQKQGVIFKYLARLMFEIPDATIHTLLDLMENGETYMPYVDKLDASAQRFYRTQFFQKGYDDTKQQIARRLWGILANGTLARLFSGVENKIDMFDAINSGKIVLINVAKDLLQEDGAQILGRFFIAMVMQATIQRSVIPENKRRATMFYIDEAHEYIDDNVETLLNQARKFKVGLILAHQNLDQLSTQQRSTFASSTSIKIVGGASAKDARAMAHDMRCEEDYILGMRKSGSGTEFACYVKNVTPSAIKLSVPFGTMEKMEQVDDTTYQELLNINRARYCTTAVGATAPSPITAKVETSGGFTLGAGEPI